MLQKYATYVFMVASITFGVAGIKVVQLGAEGGDSIWTKIMMISVFVLLPAFAISVAEKYLRSK